MLILKNKTFLLVIIASVVLVSSLAMAAPVNKVSNTVHNFAYGGLAYSFKASDPAFTQVCIFCHTPHNAGKTKWLWNKANSTSSPTTFRLYTSSATLTNVTKSSSLPAGSPSLLCLSCHDGKTAMNVLHNSTGSGISPPGDYPAGSKLIPTNTFGDASAIMDNSLPDPFTGAIKGWVIGGASGEDLTNDHPIGFSYSAAYDQRPSGLHTVVDAKSAGIRFFDLGSELNKVECSSCHNPHVDSSLDENLKPFLVKSNVGSALCLACHDK